MKFVNAPDRQVEVGGLGETVAMSIKADARAFKNLVDSIYSEKEKTVARELIANALDAMAASGRADEKIVVHLPTMFEPEFSVRDFGVGMSHDFIMTHYSCLFDSTKQDDNGQTGMFGVGSKSPLSITDTFTIKCFDPPDGAGLPARCRIYVVSIPEKGVPSISHTFNTALDDPFNANHRGVEISVPISGENHDKLVEGLADQEFFWFDKNIEFIGAADELKQHLHAAIIKLTDGLYMSSQRYGSSWDLSARQGAAVYPIVEHQIRNHITDQVKSMVASLCGHGRKLFIDLPIGTADVTLARENIQYGSQTCENIALRITEIFNSFADKLNGVIGDSTTYPCALDKLVMHAAGKTYSEANWQERKMAASLLPVVSLTVIANHTTKYGEQDEESLKANPVPDMRPSIRTSQIGEGKIIFHEGKLYHSNGSASMRFEGIAGRTTFKHPNVVYIIPTHMTKWRNRLKEHAREYFKSEQFGGVDLDERNGISVRVIRCAKRHIDSVVALLKRNGVYYSHFTVADLLCNKDEATGVPKTRNYSKTSVYPFVGSVFSENKIEPDYTQPAYYVARIGITQEMTFLHPLHTVNVAAANRGRARRTCIGKNCFASAVKHACDLNIIDPNIPIYRVTDAQAKRLVDQNRVWQHLPTVFYDGLDNVLSGTHGMLELQISDLSGKDFVLSNLIEEAFEANGKQCVVARDLLTRLSAADRVFKYRLAVLLGRKPIVKAVNGGIKDDIINAFAAGLHVTNIHDQKRLQRYEKLNEEFDNRYNFFKSFLDHTKYGRPTDDERARTLLHVKLYTDGLIAYMQANPDTLPQTTFDELQPFVQHFDLTFMETEQIDVAA